MIAGLHLAALLLLALHLSVRALPPTPTAIPAVTDAEAAWWGLWPVTYLPVWAVWLGGLLVVAPIALYWLRRGPVAAPDHLAASDHFAASEGEASAAAGFPPWPGLVAVSALLCGAFFLFPVAHTRWGDAYMISRALAWPDPALRLTHSWQAPLDLFLHAQIWAIFHQQAGWDNDAVPVYRLLSPVAGALYLLTVLGLSRETRLAPGWLTYGLLVSLGVLQLFFGYVENYSFAAAGILAYLWLAVGVLHGRVPLWAAAALLAVTNATHPSTIVLGPSLLFLGWIARQRNQSWPTVVLHIALPMFLVAAGTVGMMSAADHGPALLLTSDRPGGGDGRWLVPLFATATRWEHYTMFSWLHLRDWLNLQLLVAPVVLPALAVMAVARWWPPRGASTVPGSSEPGQPSWETPGLIHFLLIATGFYLFFTWVWNPDYGGQRDWDLFSLSVLPGTVLLAVMGRRMLGQGRLLRAGFAPLVVLQLWHTTAWIYQNTLPWQWP